MEMQGSRQLAVTQQQAWEAINDPQVLQACIPGCESMQADGPDRYTVVMAVRIGPVAARFNGKVALSDVQAPQSCTIAFDGQGGAAGFGMGSAKVRLSPLDTGCLLAYEATAQVGGKIAQVGQRLVDGVARSMAEDFFRRFDEEMGRRHPGQAEPAGAAAVERRGMPAWGWVVALAALALGAWLLARS